MNAQRGGLLTRQGVQCAGQIVGQSDRGGLACSRAHARTDRRAGWIHCWAQTNGCTGAPLVMAEGNLQRRLVSSAGARALARSLSRARLCAHCARLSLARLPCPLSVGRAPPPPPPSRVASGSGGAVATVRLRPRRRAGGTFFSFIQRHQHKRRSQRLALLLWLLCAASSFVDATGALVCARLCVRGESK